VARLQELLDELRAGAETAELRPFFLALAAWQTTAVAWSDQARGNAAEAWEHITRNPRRTTERQHRLKGQVASGRYQGRWLEQ
jgi:hypothetical protein